MEYDRLLPIAPVETSTDRRLTPEALAELQRKATARRPRVVVTGIGAITALGLTPQDFWCNLLAGKSGIDHVTLFDASQYRTRIAAEVKGFDPTKYIEPKEVRRMGRAPK